MDTAKIDAIAEQLTTLNHTLLSLDSRLKTLEARQQRRDDFFEEMQPVLKAVMATTTDKLQSMEEQGYFSFGREALRVMERVVQSYDEQDVRALGDNIVRIMDTVRAFTQPQVLALANEASAVIERADELEPTGVFGMVRASRDEDVQRGMAVFLGLLRSLGHGVKAMRESGEQSLQRKSRRKPSAPLHAVPQRSRPPALPRNRRLVPPPPRQSRQSTPR